MSFLTRFPAIARVHRGISLLTHVRRCSYSLSESTKVIDLNQRDYCMRSFLDRDEDLIFSGVGRINQLLLRKGLCTAEDSVLHERIPKGKYMKCYLLDELFVPNTEDFGHLLKMEKEVFKNIPDDMKVFDFQVMRKAESFDLCDRWLKHIHEEERIPSIFTYLLYIRKWALADPSSKEKCEDNIIQIFKVIKDQMNYLEIEKRAHLLRQLLETKISRTELYEAFTVDGKLPDFLLPRLEGSLYYYLHICYLMQDKAMYDEVFEYAMGLKPSQNSSNESLEWLVKVYEEHPKFYGFEDLVEKLHYIGERVRLKTAYRLMIAVNSGKEGYTAQISDIDQRSATCTGCGGKLTTTLNITEESIEQLRKAIFDKVFIKGNVFINSDEEEVRAFLKFIKDNGPYNVVVDAPNSLFNSLKYHRNVAVSDNMEKMVKTILTRKPDWKILMLNKKMWGVSNLQRRLKSQFRRNLDIFKLNEDTVDDPFLLYAAITSGKDTKIISNDYFRQHKYLLLNTQVDGLLRRYLYANQLNFAIRHEKVIFFRNFDPIQDHEDRTHILVLDKMALDKMGDHDVLNHMLPVLCIDKAQKKG